MADTGLRGGGLMRVHDALAAVAADAQRQNLERFDRSPPPPYSDHQSHNSTLLESPESPDHEQQRRSDERWRLINEASASFPYDQLRAQSREETAWLFQGESDRTRRLPIGINVHQLAHDNVRKRWEEQGIWNKNWSSVADGLWKHEEPLELDADASPHGEGSSGFRVSSQLEPTDRRSAKIKQRDASRPIHQFLYQLSFYRERYLENDQAPDADINSQAYAMVKNSWMKQKIWDETWGIIPGMSWKHEKLPRRPLPEPVQEPRQIDTPRVNLFGIPDQSAVSRPATGAFFGGREPLPEPVQEPRQIATTGNLFAQTIRPGPEGFREPSPEPVQESRHIATNGSLFAQTTVRPGAFLEAGEPPPDPVQESRQTATTNNWMFQSVRGDRDEFLAAMGSPWRVPDQSAVSRSATGASLGVTETSEVHPDFTQTMRPSPQQDAQPSTVHSLDNSAALVETELASKTTTPRRSNRLQSQASPVPAHSDPKTSRAKPKPRSTNKLALKNTKKPKGVSKTRRSERNMEPPSTRSTKGKRGSRRTNAKKSTS